MHWGHGHGPGHAPPRGRGDPWSEMFSEWWRGPAPRCERGLVRWLVLDAIAAQPRHGYEIIQAIAEKSRGTYKPSPGVVYPTLQMLEDVGHARAVVQGDRKTYEVTAEGKRELREHASEVAEFYQGGEDDGWERHADDVAHVMKRIGRVIRLFKHAMRRGGVRPTTLRKMKTILDDALVKLEDLLAVEEP
ncbi:MAG TPA: PadR family transcriptional regulator [Polyangiaceae bacterium]|nr:PadR family transcriptional regulator [Polyangiaceae bacterium]